MDKPLTPPVPPLSNWQQVQKTAQDAAEVAASKAKALADMAGEKITKGLESVDGKLEISRRLSAAGESASKSALEIDERFDLSGKAKRLSAETREKLDQVQQKLESVTDQTGVSEAAHTVADAARKLKKSILSSDAYKTTADASESTYGRLRQRTKDLFAPDLPTFDHNELLRATERNLACIAACIMQIGVAESSAMGRQFSRIVFAKASGAATAAGILALVAAFGTAGTGTAIATLSGAAATSASLAFVGGLVGGGVAAGAALTGGASLIVGLASYKLLSSERRPVESLSELEQWVVQSCWALAGICAEYRRTPYEISVSAVTQLLEGGLRPLYARVEENLDRLCTPLDVKNAVSLRQQALPDFKSGVLDRLALYLGWLHSEQGQAWLAYLGKDRPEPGSGQARIDAPGLSDGAPPAPECEVIVDDQRAMYVIGGVFAALLTRQALDGSPESERVLEALRRSATLLRSATESDLTDYLYKLTNEQRIRIAWNVKGIYHELAFVHQYNEEHTQTFARLYETTNHAGADVQIFDANTGEFVSDIQLKAVGSLTSVYRHLSRYPDIPVQVTDEVAPAIDHPNVSASGFSNDDLRAKVNHDLGTLHDHTVLNRAEDTAIMSMGASSVQEVIQMMRGERQFPDAVLITASRVGMAAGATAMAALLFG